MKLALSLFGGVVIAGVIYAASKNDGISQPDLSWLTLAAFIYGFLVLLCTFNPGVIRPVGWVCTFAYFCVWLYLLFTPTTYGLFLRTVGYGGGLPVTVEIREHPESPVQPLSGFLMLRTTEAMMIFMPGTTTPDVVEVPRDLVRAIRHPAGSLRNLKYRMPE
ncbi:hypothetical protein ACSFA0_24955 [Variovorax sp. LT1P1]|uniref:hypothetical protein n=1 Tax=Variovorax sp. LT1P1 TaxID=3443730 RepID=UPI003F486815